MLFIFGLTQQLDLDKKDIIGFFQELRLFLEGDFSNNLELLNNVENLFELTSITKLDIKRIYRYLDKTVKKDIIIDEEIEN